MISKSPRLVYGLENTVIHTYFGSLPAFPVKGFVDFFEVFVGDVGVDLGGGYVGVTEEGLYGAKIGAIF